MLEKRVKAKPSFTENELQKCLNILPIRLYMLVFNTSLHTKYILKIVTSIKLVSDLCFVWFPVDYLDLWIP